MKPAPFSYHRPGTREEVDGLLAELGPEAKLLAGGQSLIPILNMRLAAPEHLIDLNFLRDEAADPVLDDGTLVFGPLVRQAAAERSPLVAERLPLMVEVLAHVAHPAIRSRGTVVGSIAHADPAAELPALFVLLEGEARVRADGPADGRRASDLFVSHLETSSSPASGSRRSACPRTPGGAFEEFARRHGDYALCGVAALAADGGVAFSFVGMGATPVRFVGDVARRSGSSSPRTTSTPPPTTADTSPSAATRRAGGGAG